MRPSKVWLSWSTGKDSAWALHELRRSPDFEVTALLTTINLDYKRVAMHAVREELVDAQAEAIGLPLVKVLIPAKCSNDIYDAAMVGTMAQARSVGVNHVVFGDLFLEDIRRYREDRLRSVGMSAVFPLWGCKTNALARTMTSAGLQAYLTCVDPKQLDRSFVGRSFDKQLLDEFPKTVDPCGENGEFHSFTFDGPMFKHPLNVRVGEVQERDGFVFADVLPLTSVRSATL